MTINTNDTLIQFYPRHYVENIPIEFVAIRKVLEWWFENEVILRYHRNIRQLILVGCVDSMYMNSILRIIHVSYVDSERQISFIMAKKSILSIDKLHSLIRTYLFPGNTPSIRIDSNNKSMIINFYDFPNLESFHDAEPYFLFLRQYLYRILPPYYNIYINGIYKKTISDFGYNIRYYMTNHVRIIDMRDMV